MGLVATWLSGIGLSGAVPTFQAAGIVTPAALAELDVAHFEALGISDPDDRRKLFYLVQRIKMAVNKNARQDGTMEEQVEAVISGSIDATTTSDTIDDFGNSDYVEDDGDAKEMEEENDINQELNRRSPGKEFKDTRRRSKRLAAKQGTTNGGTAKENRSLNRTKSAEERQPQRETRITTRSARNSSRLKQREVQSSVQWDDEMSNAFEIEDVSNSDTHGTDADNLEVSESYPKHSSSSSRGLNKASLSRAKSLDSSDQTDSLPDDTPSQRRRHLESSPSKTGRRKSKTSLPVVTKAADLESTNNFSDAKATTPVSKMQVPRARRPESKIQNPSKSLRTGKQLSSIPSETIAPNSPLVHLTSSKMEEDIEVQARTRKRTSKAPASDDSLDRMLQSSDSETELSLEDLSELASESQSDLNFPKLQRSRSKSLGTSDSALGTRKPQRSIGGRMTSRKSNGKARTEVESSASKRNAKHKFSGSSRSTSCPVGVFVHGTAEPDSWKTQIARLREDNDAEHELFGDQVDEGLYEYDMRIRVVVKKRPVSSSENKLSGGIDVIHPLDYGDYGRILVYQPKTRVDLTKEVETIPFAFDNVFDETSTNIQIYKRTVRNLVIPFFEGKWATIFAYGQTGSGKTYTMMGSNMTGMRAGTSVEDDSNLGLYYLAALDIFELARQPEYAHLSIGVSLFEIYGGKLFDLIHGRKQIKCLEDSRGKVCFPGLSEHTISGPDELMALIENGASNRSTGNTSRNADSSRSHAVLQLNLRKTVGRKKNMEHARLTFIDLAGSERGADTSSSSRATRLEGAEINTSLLALKEVIRALATGGSMTHIPFRGSKLTQVLKDSFVGENSRCCMIACISPDIGNCEQTLNTLRYADRVKERNADSGALASGYEQPTRGRPLNATTFSPTNGEKRRTEAEPGLEEKVEDDEEADEVSVNKPCSEDGDTVVLDALLSTSLHERSVSSDLGYMESTIQMSSKRRAGEALVSAHRSVMSSMLAMVKNEMALVNKVDADRDGLDDYLAELEVMQNTQLTLITKLRQSLHTYVSASEGAGADDATNVSDDSFEDLRD